VGGDHLSAAVAPPEALEVGEVGVAGAELGAVLDRERRQMRVASQVAADAERAEEAPQKAGMSDGRSDRRRAGAVEPGVDVVERLVGSATPRRSHRGGG
jgi:hypothetical protein